jgi:hypothetical protein
VAKQVCDGVDVNASVKKHLGEGVSEAMKGDVLLPDAESRESNFENFNIYRAN